MTEPLEMIFVSLMMYHLMPVSSVSVFEYMFELCMKSNYVPLCQLSE